jgi:hypothetical protein
VTAAARPQDRLVPPAADPTQATPALHSPVERARGVEATVLKQSEDTARRIDERAR